MPQLPPQLAAVQPLLERLMAKRPEDRFAAAAQAADELEKLLAAWLTPAAHS